MTGAGALAVAIVTGAGQGVGLATAQRLAASGYRTVLVGRDRGKLDSAAAEITGPTLCVAADLAAPDQVESVFTAVEQEWGPAEVLVANAGTALAASITTTTDAQWQQMIESNLTAPFRCIRRALPPMLEEGHGRIVVIASVVAKRGERQVSAYTASKHSVLGLVRAVADEVARSGVTANAVCPGYVDTPMTDATVETIAAVSGRSAELAREGLARKQPIGRLISPEEVADAVRFCVDSAALTGQGITIDGGAVQA